MSTTAPPTPENAVAAQTIAETIFYLCLKDKTLTETEYNDGFSNPIFVGYAKPNSPVAYTVADGNRIVVCLDDGNHVQDYEQNPEEGEWNPGQLGVLKAVAHPNTKIAACSSKEKCVYYQNASGEIQEATSGADDLWKLSIALPAAQPILGTSIAAVGLADGIHAFYINQDGSIHNAAYKNGAWSDSVLKGTLDDTMKTTVNASASENGFVVRYTNEKGECFNFENGKNEKMGDIVNGDFKPKTNAQCYRGGTVIIIIIFGGCYW